MSASARTVARVIVECLENEGVEIVFGLPGEENLHTIDALADSSIRFVTTRDERGAAFMADTYGALTGRPGVCLATLGPGAINLMLGVANAQLDSHPLVALVAQASLDRIYKESHQFVDLVSLFRPITKWGDMVTVRVAAPEMVRKAFKQATTEPPGATFIVLPEDVAERATDARVLPVNTPVDTSPDEDQVRRAAEVLASAKHPVVLAGPGVARDGAAEALIRFSERLNLPVATTFLGKGVFPDSHPNALGTIGFMVKDYVNFGFDRADVVVAVGYDLVEYSPVRWNPLADKADRARASHGGRGRCSLHARGRVAGQHRRDARRDLRVQHRATGPRGDLPRARSRAGRTRAGRRRRHVPDGSRPRGLRHQIGARGRRHRPVRHGRGEDVDGAPVPDAPPEHLPDLERPRDDGVLPARRDRREARASRSGRCSRRWATGRSR